MMRWPFSVIHVDCCLAPYVLEISCLRFSVIGCAFASCITESQALGSVRLKQGLYSSLVRIFFTAGFWEIRNCNGSYYVDN